MTRLKVWTGGALMAGALAMIQMPAQAIPVTTIFTDNFSTTSQAESVTGSVDSMFNILSGTNVDIIGNIIPVPSNLVPFEGACTTSGTANCIDLDGTTTNPQSGLTSIAMTLGAGTYNLSYDLLGSAGFLSSGVGFTQRSGVTSSTLVLFGSLSCITNHTGCIYSNTVTLGGTDTTDGNISVTGLSVTGGTDYIAFISNTSGFIGSLLAGATLTENPPSVPEPGTMLLVGSALLGLGGMSRLRKSR